MHRAHGSLLSLGSACLSALLVVTGGGAVLAASPVLGPPGPSVAAGSDCPAPAAPEPVTSPTPVPSLPPPGEVDPYRANALDAGPGRLALCLVGASRIEADAECLWNEHRDGIEAVSAERVVAAGRKRAVGLMAGLEIRSRTDPTVPDVAFLFRNRFTHHTVDQGSVEGPTQLGPTGVVRFRAPAEGRRQPRVLSGSLSWTCGAPPERDPGTTDGTLDVMLAGPRAGTFSSRASCHWVDRDGTPAVGTIESLGDATAIGDGHHVAELVARLDRPIREPSVTVELRVSDQTEPDRSLRVYVDDIVALPVVRAADDATGTVRALALARGRGAGPRTGTRRARDVRGAQQALIRWSCGSPPAAVTTPSSNSPETFKPGTLQFRVSATDGPTLDAPASCRVADIDGRPLVLHRAATYELGDLRGQLLVLPPDLDMVVLLLTDATGAYRGEYVAAATDQSGWADGRDGTGATTTLSFEPGTLVVPPPLFGATETGPFQATIAWSCEATAG